MVEPVINSLLSGMVGAIAGVIAAIAYEEYRYRKQNKRTLAEEKLKRLYGPLMFFIKRDKKFGEKFTLVHTEDESNLIDNIIRDSYYLADDDFKEDVLILHSLLRYQEKNADKINEIVSKIEEGYKRNKQILDKK